jgi:hypothetical protein
LPRRPTPLANRWDPNPGLFTLRDLFPRHRWQPRTEEEWQQWLASDADDDFEEEYDRLLSNLRTAVLREIAGKVTGHPALPKYSHEVTDAMIRFGELREHGRERRPRRFNPASVQTATNAIERLRAKARDDMIAGLADNQVTALAAVAASTPEGFEPFDAFTFDVLGRMGLLQRKPNGRKSKRDWDLTAVGRLALERRRGASSSPTEKE